MVNHSTARSSYYKSITMNDLKSKTNISSSKLNEYFSCVIWLKAFKNSIALIVQLF